MRLRMLPLLFSLLLASMGWLAGARASDSLPEVEPTREWLGAEYADTLIAKFRARYPGVELRIDPRDVQLYAPAAPEPEAAAPEPAPEPRPQRRDPTWLERLQQRVRRFWRNPDQVTVREHIISAAQKLMGPRLSRLFRQLEHGDFIPLAEGEDVSRRHVTQLREWVLAQADRSLYPDDLMIESLRLHEGRVVAAWTTAWNLMRDGWEYAATRNHDAVRAKFRSVTGERHLWRTGAQYVVLAPEEREPRKVLAQRLDGHRHRWETLTLKPAVRLVVTKRGDEFSSIYHRIGVELLTMITSRQSGSSRVGWALGSTGAWGEYLKYTQTAGLALENRKRIRNDLNSAVSGARLYELIKNRAAAPAPDAATAAHYLRPNPELFGKDYQLTDGRPPAYFGSKVDPKFWAPVMSVEELKLRYRHREQYDRHSLDPVALVSSGDHDRLLRGLDAYLVRGADDAELNRLLRHEGRELWRKPLRPDVTRDLNFHDHVNAENLGLRGGADPFHEHHREIFERQKAVIALAEANAAALRPKPAVARLVPLSRTGAGAGRCEAIHGN